jgi:vitamin B12 transporter
MSTTWPPRRPISAGQLSGTTQIRGTAALRRGRTGVPNAWDFYHVADSATQKDQDLFISGSIDNQTTPTFTRQHPLRPHPQARAVSLWRIQNGSVRLRLLRPGILSATGGHDHRRQRLLRNRPSRSRLRPDLSIPVFSGLQSRSALYQGDYRFTPHLMGAHRFPL